MTCAEPASVFISFEMKTGLGSRRVQMDEQLKRVILAKMVAEPMSLSIVFGKDIVRFLRLSREEGDDCQSYCRWQLAC